MDGCLGADVIYSTKSDECLARSSSSAARGTSSFFVVRRWLAVGRLAGSLGSRRAASLVRSQGLKFGRGADYVVSPLPGERGTDGESPSPA